MSHNTHHKSFVRLLLCAAVSTSVGCASTEARKSATWLAAAANGVKAKAGKYKEQRDALVKARHMSINALEQSAAALEASTQTTTAFWDIPDPTKNPQKDLFEKILAESEAAERRQQEWVKLRQEHEKKVAEAQSSVASVGEKLGETTRLLTALGTEPDFKGQVETYVEFLSAVNTSLKKLEEEARQKQEEGGAAAEDKSKQAAAEVSRVNPEVGTSK